MGKTTTSGSVTITDNSDDYKKYLGVAKAAILRVIGGKGEGHAKDGCPVDTGRLRNSITHAEDDNSTYIGSNVEYAEWNEYHNKRKPHFLRNAATQHTPEYEAVVKAGLVAAKTYD